MYNNKGKVRKFGQRIGNKIVFQSTRIPQDKEEMPHSHARNGSLIQAGNSSIPNVQGRRVICKKDAP